MTAIIPVAGAEQQSFHAAQSAPEKMLDNIIRYSEVGSTSEDLVTGKITRNQSDYARLFTKKLLISLVDVQAREVQKNCGGKYLEDQICGIDADPVSCAQDVDDRPYFYRTLTEDENVAVIAYHWQDQAASSGGPLYRLVKVHNKWKLDGIRCDDQLKFNME